MRTLTNKRLGRRALLAILLPLTFLSTACDLEELLEVETPGKVPEESLDNPTLARTLMNSVITDFECSWDGYVGAAAIHSDQFIQSSGNLTMRLWANRGITAEDANFAQGACQDWGYGLYTPLQTARYQADNVFTRLEGFTDAQVANRVSMQATVRAYGAWTMIAFGEGFCEVAIDGGPLMTRKQILELAEKRFGEAIDLATRSGNADILNMSLSGRARVRLDLENFRGAIDDAAKVPATYVKLGTRDANDPRRYNHHHEWVNGAGWRHASVAPNYRALTWKGTADPRVRATNSGRNGFDFVTPWWYHQKTTGRETPNRLTSPQERQLIIAEASARLGDLETARRILNELHQAVNIPGVVAADAPTQDDVIKLVLEERNRELFAEGGARLNDMIRFRGTKFNIPFRGETGSIHPAGVDQIGQTYGPTTCFPLPAVERNGNPSLK
jgi:starch-binding outer membrane protein, SusD/RagB family